MTGMSTDALSRAIEAAGGQKQLADKIGTKQPNVSYWMNKSKKGVPGEYAAAIEAATGIRKEELRPDIFAVEERAQ